MIMRREHEQKDEQNSASHLVDTFIALLRAHIQIENNMRHGQHIQHALAQSQIEIILLWINLAILSVLLSKYNVAIYRSVKDHSITCTQEGKGGRKLVGDN